MDWRSLLSQPTRPEERTTMNHGSDLCKALRVASRLGCSISRPGRTGGEGATPRLVRRQETLPARDLALRD
jgi:hypothetical protein